MKDIIVYDRLAQTLLREKVYGDYWLKLFYQNKYLRQIVSQDLVQSMSSKALGLWKNSSFSRMGVKGFVGDYEIPMADFVTPEGGFRSFNDFFIRQFRSGIRQFPKNSNELGALAEGRLSAFKIDGPELPLNIKGKNLSLGALLGSEELVEDYLGGWLMVFRLCPVDYHRFHFFDAGVPGDSLLIEGALHSVNPVAVQKIPEVFLLNERRVCVMQTETFGKVLIMEIGALGVGRIVQTYRPSVRVERGQEKGYFSFGGSTSVVLFGKDQIQPSKDILEKNAEGFEVLVRLGEVIGTKI